MTTDIERGGIDVSGSHEPSYYEIALTNRQVVVAFVILLVCVVAAFLSGVWIGRESTARAQEKMALLARAAANDSADKDKTEGQALQEFKFFADPRHRPSPAAPPTSPAAAAPDAAAKPAAAAADTSSNPGDDSGRAPQAPPAPAAGRNETRTARAATAPAGPAHSAPQASATPDGAGAADSVVHPRPLPDAPAPSVSAARKGAGEASPSSAPAGASAPTNSADTGAGANGANASNGAIGSNAANASNGAGEVVIQVFSSADREQADRVRGGLVDAGFQAFLSPLAKNGQTMYRVRIGPFATRASAEPVAEKVRKEQKLDTWITPK
jgi:DedD protein